MSSTLRSIAIITLLTATGVALIFLGFVGWYTWQLSAGGDQALSLAEQFEPELFTSITNNESNRSVPNIHEYIRPHNPTFGSLGAPITVVAFVDFECPFCRRSFATFESVRAKYEPAVRVVFKQYPLEVLHPRAKAAAVAAQCAHAQDKFWDYHEVLFSQLSLSDTNLLAYAPLADLDTERFRACLSDATVINQVQLDIADGIALGVRGTPTYIINGNRVEGVVSAEQWDTIFLSLLSDS